MARSKAQTLQSDQSVAQALKARELKALSLRREQEEKAAKEREEKRKEREKYFEELRRIEEMERKKEEEMEKREERERRKEEERVRLLRFGAPKASNKAPKYPSASTSSTPRAKRVDDEEGSGVMGLTRDELKARREQAQRAKAFGTPSGISRASQSVRGKRPSTSRPGDRTRESQGVREMKAAEGIRERIKRQDPTLIAGNGSSPAPAAAKASAGWSTSPRKARPPTPCTLPLPLSLLCVI